MPIGYGAGLGGTAAGKRKLGRVNTFKDIAKNKPTSPVSRATAGPSMPQGPGMQPGGFGPGPGIRKNIDPAIGRGLPGGVTTAATGTGYVSPRVPDIPGAAGAPAGGLPAPSPTFGAAVPGFGAAPGFAPGAEPSLTEAGKMVPAGPYLTGTEEAGRVPSFQEEMEEGDILPGDPRSPLQYDPLAGEYRPAAEPARGAAGLSPEEQEGLVYDDPTTAAKTDLEMEQDAEDEEFNELIDQLDVSQEAAQNKLDAAFAKAQRRNAAVNAQMGSSLAGGYQGQTTQTTLGYLQQMADMMADFQTRKTNMQLDWLDKKTSRDFQREMSERSETFSLIQGLLASEQEVPESMWAKAGIGPEQKANMLAGGEGAGPEGTTGEAGALKNEAGDLLMGAGGLGTSGEIQADPWAEDGESHQWYARSTGEGQYEYYRIDENGDEVAFETSKRGPRFPGDTSLFHRSQYGSRSGFMIGDDAIQQGTAFQYPGSAYSSDKATVVSFLDQIARAFDPSNDHEDFFGGGLGKAYQQTDDDTSPSFMGIAGTAQKRLTADYYYPSPANPSVQAAIEVGQFISMFQQQNDGVMPDEEDIFDHLQRSGSLPQGMSETANPFGGEE